MEVLLTISRKEADQVITRAGSCPWGTPRGEFNSVERPRTGVGNLSPTKSPHCPIRRIGPHKTGTMPGTEIWARPIPQDPNIYRGPDC